MSDEFEQPAPQAGSGTRVGRLRAAVSRHAWVGLVIAAGLVLTQVVDFKPPQKVRVEDKAPAQLVGDAPAQEFSNELGNEQAVQVRATLRLYPSASLEVGAPDPEIDAQAQILSQPVVTTILGLNATLDQSVSLDGGALTIDIGVQATPRLIKGTKKNDPGTLTVEHEIRVTSAREEGLIRKKMDERLHLDARGALADVETSGHRIVFSVDDHLFALDLEVHRPLG